MSCRNRFPLRALTVLAASAVVAAGCGDDEQSDGVSVGGAWARPTPAGTTTGAVYLTLQAEEDDALVGVSVDPTVATSAMAHGTTSSDGQMSMDHAAGIAMPAGEDVTFEPGGYHVMLDGLAEPLVAGDAFELTLDFEHADDVVVEVSVRDEAP